MHRAHWRLAATLTVLVAACRPSFQLKNYTTNEDLYKAGLRQFQRHKWDNAIAAFEKLTVELPARDTLLPRSYWYLASAHEHQGEHLLAAQSFSRLTESFPEDSLADDAALESARSYRRLWRRPQLDDSYGQTAQQAYQTLITLYPSSPLIPAAQKELGELEDWFAQKNYGAGMFYLRQHAYDSAIIYFKGVLDQWPDAPTARKAGVSLAQAYRAIRYREDASELCTLLRRKYANDSEVRDACSGVPDATTAATPAAPTTDSAPPRGPPNGAR